MTNVKAAELTTLLLEVILQRLNTLKVMLKQYLKKKVQIFIILRKAMYVYKISLISSVLVCCCLHKVKLNFRVSD